MASELPIRLEYYKDSKDDIIRTGINFIFRDNPSKVLSIKKYDCILFINSYNNNTVIAKVLGFRGGVGLNSIVTGIFYTPYRVEESRWSTPHPKMLEFSIHLNQLELNSIIKIDCPLGNDGYMRFDGGYKKNKSKKNKSKKNKSKKNKSKKNKSKKTKTI